MTIHVYRALDMFKDLAWAQGCRGNDVGHRHRESRELCFPGRAQTESTRDPEDPTGSQGRKAELALI